MHKANKASDQNIKSLRLSIDSKAKVKIGNLSRNGKARTIKKANDHDTEWISILVPFGILNLDTDKLSIYFGSSAETSDFIVDCLTKWWEEHKDNYADLEELVIDLDGGSATRSNRTQFIKRIVELAKSIGIRIRLIYYPPYHSKYNPIERCWAALENYWNGAILDSVQAAVKWAKNMTWKGSKPNVQLITETYEKKIKVSRQELSLYTPFWLPSENLPKWDITILPLERYFI